ncbi:PLP-dependent aminotransferase family protein [Opitutus sp. ER46]|uniref:MocR-like pyridoxine biosynthesis transcription factor PdxR n=1 Tax=Opitutus sp. ER46 TaxID=2161864 RepID=UPI001304C640|nr:PLP-dependent aminotransferase family protein [Opitutus sp. ER46]
MPRLPRFQDFPLAPRPRHQPLHRWLHGELRRAIVGGRLAPGARLPSSRDLARQQGLARATVVGVFAQLRAEGYLVTRHGSGTVVAAALPDPFIDAAPARPQRAIGPGSRASHNAPAAIATSRSRSASATAATSPASPAPAAFDIYRPSLDAFPLAIWAQLTSRRLRLGRTALLTAGDPLGYRPLRAAIAEHLAATRSVVCDVDRIAVVSGTQQAFDFILRLLLRPGDHAWMENPGYPGAARLLRRAGAHVVPIPVDAAGMVVPGGRRQPPAPAMIYVTPAHQFPLGATLSLERRLALLALARDRGTYVFEDDYDGAFRYDVRPLGALQENDRANRVIYAGSFNKLLFPGLRLGYVVLPTALVAPFAALREAVDRYTSPIEQAVLADFIAEGHFERHLRRMRNRYREGRDALFAAARRHLGTKLNLQPTEAGIHAVGFLPASADDVRVQRRAAEAGINVTALSPFYLQGPARPGLLLGFAAPSEVQIARGMETLARVLRPA